MNTINALTTTEPRQEDYDDWDAWFEARAAYGRRRAAAAAEARHAEIGASLGTGPLADAARGDEIFNEKQEDCRKVILTPGRSEPLIPERLEEPLVAPLGQAGVVAEIRALLLAGKRVFQPMEQVAMFYSAFQSATAALEKVSVTAEVLGEERGPKIVIQKFKNKTGYKKRQGHRQELTRVKITGIK